MNSPQTSPAPVTRIARRRAQAGHEPTYEALVREMFATMRSSPGFLGADLLPPEQAGGGDVARDFSDGFFSAGTDRTATDASAFSATHCTANGSGRVVMTWVVMPRLTKLIRPWLNQAAK